MLDYAVDVKVRPRRYSQSDLKKFYLEAGGRIEKCVNGKRVTVKENYGDEFANSQTPYGER